MRKLLSVLLLVVLAGCGDDETPPASGIDCSGPCYVIATAVSDADGATTYVRVMDHVETGELDLSGAREFGGWSDIKVHGGKLFVSSGEAPEVQRFIVADDGALVPDGSIGFGNVSSDANMYAQVSTWTAPISTRPRSIRRATSTSRTGCTRPRRRGSWRARPRASR